MMVRLHRMPWSACLALACGGCSVFSYEPTWELVKATGTAASYMAAGVPVKATDTVRHQHLRFTAICIVFNPDVQSQEVVPAIQASLQQRHVDSRVFDSVSSVAMCPAWLHYTALVDWGAPPVGTGVRPYVAQALLTLKTSDGRVLASSAFAAEGAWEIGKWASTKDKVDAIVNALLAAPDGQSGL